MENNQKITANWEMWLEIEGKMRRWVFGHWFNPTVAEDVLAGGMMKFATKNKGFYPIPQRIRFAQDCCREAAREQGFFGAKGDTEQEPETVSISANTTPLEQVADGSMSVLDCLLQLEANAEQMNILRLLSPRLRRVVEAILGGARFGEAAEAEGMTSSQLSKELAWIRGKGAARRQSTRAKEQDSKEKQFLLF